MRKFLLRSVTLIMAMIGVTVVLVMVALSVPLRTPPFLPSIQRGALAIDQSKLQPYTRFTARDGTELAYRLYRAESDQEGKIAILVHGSSGNGRAMTAVAAALAQAGCTAVAIDIRGHGASGQRGDIGFIGQLEEDLEDLVLEIKKNYPKSRFMLIGHSSGGGFALRIAGEKTSALFDRFVLISPYIGHRAPTNREQKGDVVWASPDMPRIFALLALNHVGIDALNGLPTLAFATAPGAEHILTTRYSYRLMMNFGPPSDWRTALNNLDKPAALIIGTNDELFDASKYPEAISGYERKVRLAAVPGIDHMGAIRETAAIETIVRALSEEPGQ